MLVLHVAYLPRFNHQHPIWSLWALPWVILECRVRSYPWALQCVAPKQKIIIWGCYIILLAIIIPHNITFSRTEFSGTNETWYISTNIPQFLSGPGNNFAFIAMIGSIYLHSIQKWDPRIPVYLCPNSLCITSLEFGHDETSLGLLTQL